MRVVKASINFMKAISPRIALTACAGLQMMPLFILTFLHLDIDLLLIVDGRLVVLTRLAVVMELMCPFHTLVNQLLQYPTTIDRQASRWTVDLYFLNDMGLSMNWFVTMGSIIVDYFLIDFFEPNELNWLFDEGSAQSNAPQWSSLPAICGLRLRWVVHFKSS